MGYRLEELFQVTVKSISDFEGVSEERMANITRAVTGPDAFATYEQAKDFGALLLNEYEEIDYFTINKTFILFDEE